MRRQLLGIVSFVSLLFVGACAEVSIQNAQSFATLATAYQDKLPPLIDTRFELAVAQSSRQLVRSHPALTPDERLEQLSKADETLSKQLEAFQLIKKQAQNLRSTFVLLNTIASSEGGEQISSAAKSLLDEVDSLSNQALVLKLLGESKFTDRKATIQAAIDGAASFLVAQYKAHAIRKFMEEHGGTIHASLTAQEELLAALSEDIGFYRGISLQSSRTDDVAIPYSNDSPPNLEAWTSKRLHYYRAELNLADLEAAKTAAQNVRLAFAALAEGRISAANISVLVKDIERLDKLVVSAKTMLE